MIAGSQAADFRMNMHGAVAGSEGHPALHVRCLRVQENRDGLADRCGLAFGGIVLGHRLSTKAQGRNADQGTHRQRGDAFLDRHVISPMGCCRFTARAAHERGLLQISLPRHCSQGASPLLSLEIRWKAASGFKKCSTLALFHETQRFCPSDIEPHHGQGLSSHG